jgi:hypothetical protein
MGTLKKQTAVEWLEEELAKKLKLIVLNQDYQLMETLFEQAKVMEKEQMDIVAGDWWNEGASYMHDVKRKYESFEQYYNETYGGDK